MRYPKCRRCGKRNPRISRFQKICRNCYYKQYRKEHSDDRAVFSKQYIKDCPNTVYSSKVRCYFKKLDKKNRRRMLKELETLK